MARAGNQPLQQSFFDRLLEDEAVETIQPPGRDLRDLREAVRRDLEALLNTRQPCIAWPAAFDELKVSPLNYGLPDYSGSDLASSARREEFRRTVEEVIRSFEPRFFKVSVVLLDNDGLDRTLRFRIEALMYASPAPESVVFDSVVDPTSRAVAIIGDRRG